MPQMRAKYLVEAVTATLTGAEMVRMSAVTNGTKEDNTFHKYTPYGNMEITITNPDLLGIIKPGQKYYLDFTLAEE